MYYVISDLHGCSPEKLFHLLQKVKFSEADYCYVLGDVIDRGEHGIELLQYMMSQPNIELIKGNHEAMMTACSFLFEDITISSANKLSVNDMHALSTWVSNGGQVTIDSMRSKTKKERLEIMDYVKDAPLYALESIKNQDFILTHSGLGNFRKNKKITQYTPDELLWNRPTPEDSYFDNITTVFGHTPTLFYGNEYKGRIYNTNTWIDIDVGVAAGFDPALLCLDTMEIFYCEEH